MGLSSRKTLLLLAIFCVIYAVAIGILAYPYHPVPTDDLPYLRYLRIPFDLETVFGTLRPFVLLSLTMVDFVWSVFSTNQLQSLLLQSVLSLSGTAFLVGWMVFRMTRQFAPALVASLLVATSAWTINYLFFYSYSTFTTFWMTLIAALFCEAYFQVSRRNIFLALAIAAMGCGVLCAPSTGLLLGCFFAGSYYLFHREVSIVRLTSNYGFLGLALTILALQTHLRAKWNIHLYENAFPNGHQGEAIRILGYLPSVPFFSFFHILDYYGRFLLLGFLFCSAALIGNAFRSFRRPTLPSVRFALFLLLIVLAHCVVLDLSPHTKLARTQFQVFPLLVALTIGTFGALRLGSFLPKWVASVFVFVAILQGLGLGKQIRELKQETPEVLKDQFAAVSLFTLEEDLHSQQLHRWLFDTHITRVSLKQFQEKIRTDPSPAALLLGPTGVGSGITISASPNWFVDFHPEKIEGFSALKPDQTIALKYFSQLPSFLMEEEILQGLYFEKKEWASYGRPSNTVKLLVFNSR